MRTVTVPGLRTFQHNGQTYRRGDMVTLAPIDAAILKRLGHVSLSSGQYLRSDLTADATMAQGDASAPPASRRHRRRHAAEQDAPA